MKKPPERAVFLSSKAVDGFRYRSLSYGPGLPDTAYRHGDGLIAF